MQVDKNVTLRGQGSFLARECGEVKLLRCTEILAIAHHGGASPQIGKLHLGVGKRHARAVVELLRLGLGPESLQRGVVALNICEHLPYGCLCIHRQQHGCHNGD